MLKTNLKQKLLAMIIAGFAAIAPMSAQESYITLSADTLTFSGDGGSQTISISSNVEWLAGINHEAVPWLSATPESGSGNAEIAISVEPRVSSGGGNYYYTIVFYNGKEALAWLEIIQKDYEPTLTYGCKDSTAVNYNPTADIHDPSLCEYSQPLTYGCKDSTAINYNPIADIHDQNLCEYSQPQAYFNLSSNILNFNSKGGYQTVNVASNVEWKTVVNADSTWVSVSPESGNGNGQVFVSVDMNTSSAKSYNLAFFNMLNEVLASLTVTQEGTEPPPTYGCKDSTAINYDPIANMHNQSLCIYPIPGCTDRYAENYDSSANVNDGSCTYKKIDEPIEGCTDAEALNYNPVATVENSSCIYKEQIQEGEPVYGCTDPKALNYNIHASDYDGSCLYPEEENTFLVTEEEILETLVDTVGTKPIEECDLTAGMGIDSANILSITSVEGTNTIIVHWEIVQGDNTIYYDVEYTVSQSGNTLFYLSIVCKNALRSTDADVVGYTVSATYDLDLDQTNVRRIEEKTNDLTVYPNPFTEILNVLVKDANVVDITLYSIDGSPVAFYHNSNEAQIATVKLPAGTYILQVVADGKTKSVVVVKK